MGWDLGLEFGSRSGSGFCLGLDLVLGSVSGVCVCVWVWGWGLGSGVFGLGSGFWRVGYGVWDARVVMGVEWGMLGVWGVWGIWCVC